jgi:hypothetical protein
LYQGIALLSDYDQECQKNVEDKKEPVALPNTAGNKCE